MRIITLMLPIILIIFMMIDNSFLRTGSAQKLVYGASLMTESIEPIPLEDQEIVNDDSINNFAKDAVSAIFNFKPGQAEEHIDSPKIKSLFISDEYHEIFKQQFVSWSNVEFQINNISIKESIIRDSSLLRSPSLGDGSRLWVFEAKLPMLNRAVGGTSLRQLDISVYLVYLGHSGGLGIYGIGLQ